MRVRNNFILRTIAQEQLLIPTGEAALSVKGRKRSRRWRDDKKLMAFLDEIR